MPDICVLDDAALQTVALTEGNDHLAFRTRGLARRHDSCISPPLTEQDVAAQPAGAWPHGAYYADASGGVHSANRLLRRVGFAAIQLPSKLVTADGFLAVLPVRCLGAALAGFAQTVNRGELQAVIAVLQQVELEDPHWTALHTDSEYVHPGVALPREALWL